MRPAVVPFTPDEIAEGLNKLRQAFQVNTLAIAAAEAGIRAAADRLPRGRMRRLLEALPPAAADAADATTRSLEGEA